MDLTNKSAIHPLFSSLDSKGQELLKVVVQSKKSERKSQAFFVISCIISSSMFVTSFYSLIYLTAPSGIFLNGELNVTDLFRVIAYFPTLTIFILGYIHYQNSKELTRHAIIRWESNNKTGDVQDDMFKLNDTAINVQEQTLSVVQRTEKMSKCLFVGFESLRTLCSLLAIVPYPFFADFNPHHEDSVFIRSCISAGFALMAITTSASIGFCIYFYHCKEKTAELMENARKTNEEISLLD
uniref:Col_cuticle_N domain-containing protein n=1 Tax=Rhabditophanes sp. KR3021 TaxID=114890 RepID=A0AC35TSP5_9BILA